MLTEGFELPALLSSVLEAISLPENATKLGEAKDNAGNDMLKMMQFVFPIVMQIEMDVIKNNGFPEGREGTVDRQNHYVMCTEQFQKCTESGADLFSNGSS